MEIPYDDGGLVCEESDETGELSLDDKAGDDVSVRGDEGTRTRDGASIDSTAYSKANARKTQEKDEKTNAVKSVKLIGGFTIKYVQRSRWLSSFSATTRSWT